MPTAATTNANSNRSLISKQGPADLSTLTQLARGPAHGGHFKAPALRGKFSTSGRVAACGTRYPRQKAALDALEPFAVDPVIFRVYRHVRPQFPGWTWNAVHWLPVRRTARSFVHPRSSLVLNSLL